MIRGTAILEWKATEHTEILRFFSMVSAFSVAKKFSHMGFAAPFFVERLVNVPKNIFDIFETD